MVTDFFMYAILPWGSEAILKIYVNRLLKQKVQKQSAGRFQRHDFRLDPLKCFYERQ